MGLTTSERKNWSIQAKMISGVLTIIPVVVVWVVLNFIFSLLFTVGAPFERALADFVSQRAPSAMPFLKDPVLEWFVAVLLALLLIYCVGAAATRVVGMRFIAFVEALIARIPFVETIYTASKKLIGVLQQQPGGSARVVLIEFPHPGLKAIGLVMRTFPDTVTGEELAAVYVPTTPNPTSGYLEIVAVKNLTPTDMTMDQAMTMILSGGVIAPARMSLAGVPTAPAP